MSDNYSVACIEGEDDAKQVNITQFEADKNMSRS